MPKYSRAVPPGLSDEESDDGYEIDYIENYKPRATKKQRDFSYIGRGAGLDGTDFDVHLEPEEKVAFDEIEKLWNSELVEHLIYSILSFFFVNRSLGRC